MKNLILRVFGVLKSASMLLIFEQQQTHFKNINLGEK